MLEREFASIHADMLAGEPTADRALVNACVKPLYAILKRSYSLLPPEVVRDAAHDALIALIRQPEQYDSERGTLLNYLVRIGKNKLADQVRACRRRSGETAVGGVVELAAAEENAYSGEGSTAWELPAGTDLASPEVEALLRTILPDPRDRLVWELICDGRTAVAELAVVLGISHLSVEEQRRQVKQHRDRVQKRVQRRQEEFRRLLS